MDYLFRGIAFNDKVRILGIDAKNSVGNICKEHHTLPLASVAFSRFLLAGSMIGVLEKNNTGITMQINSDGTIKNMFVQATSNGLIRGYVGRSDGELELSEDELKIENVVGRNGILSVSKILDSEHDFTSDVILTSSDIIHDIAYYFFTSEQIPTIVNLQVKLADNGDIKEAKGYLIQLLTGYTQEDVNYLENLKLQEIDNLEKEIRRLFPDFKKLETIAIKDVCDCSKERFYKGIATLSNEDLKELAKDEEIEVVCQFCTKAYKFTKEELLEIIKNR